MTVSGRQGRIGSEVALPTDRARALGAAHQLLEQLQDRPGDERLIAQLDDWCRAAADAGWAEVHVFLLFSGLVHADLTGRDPDRLRTLANALLAAATTYGGEPLVGLAVAARPSHLSESGHAEPFGDDLAGCLAYVVALLEDVATQERRATSVLIPAAYIECAQGYRRHDLWELEQEMYDLADASLTALFGTTEPLPSDHPARPVLDLNLRVLLFNRLESTVSLVCALLEIGRRETARAVARARRRFSAHEWADLPPTWALEARAMDWLLTVVAGDTSGPEDPAVVPADLYDAVSESAWGGYAACLLLAAALTNEEAGELATAAHLGADAVALLDDFRPSLRTLAMYLTTLGGADVPARQYAEQLARLRWESRVHVLDAARSRLSAARVLRQGELLRRQAYVDELTGLANRHDYVRHLAALRHADAGDQVTVALIDLDRFKAVNDTFGHPVGDEVLRTIGRILAGAVRSSDLAVRLGGDEFALLVGSGADAFIEGRVGTIVDTIREQDWGALAPGLVVTASAGFATGPATDVDRLLQEADRRLYRAKADGRDRSAS